MKKAIIGIGLAVLMLCIISASAVTPVPLGRVMNERAGNTPAVDPGNAKAVFAIGSMGAPQEVKNLNGLVGQGDAQTRANQIIEEVMSKKASSSIGPYSSGYTGSMETPAQAQSAAQGRGNSMPTATQALAMSNQGNHNW